MGTRQLERALQEAFLTASTPQEKAAFAQMALRLAVANLNLKKARVSARAKLARPRLQKPLWRGGPVPGPK